MRRRLSDNFENEDNFSDCEESGFEDEWEEIEPKIDTSTLEIIQQE